MDDVINVSGHRLGTAEIEDALVRHSMFLTCMFTENIRNVRTRSEMIKEKVEAVEHGFKISSILNLVIVVIFVQDEHPAVPETAVVGIPHDIKGEGEK